MMNQIKNTFFDPQRTWIPVSLVVILMGMVVSGVWTMASFYARLQVVESKPSITIEQVQQTVEIAIKKSIPELTLAFDERYLKKN